MAVYYAYYLYIYRNAQVVLQTIVMQAKRTHPYWCLIPSIFCNPQVNQCDYNASNQIHILNILKFPFQTFNSYPSFSSSALVCLTRFVRQKLSNKREPIEAMVTGKIELFYLVSILN